MKRLILAVIIILIMVPFTATGCAEEEPSVVPGEELEVISSCVACHTDKDTLKAVATTEPEEATSEETTGEG